jgi:hypothetical protein
METLFDQLGRRGLAVLEELRDNGEEETLHLEFKTLADHSSGTLTKEDRRVLAKAICGFANAEGGTLIIGVSSRNVDAVDVADELKPIAHARRVRNRFISALSEFLSPQHVGISEMVILDPAHPDAGGYIVVNVPESDRRPHMSVPEHRYFRRGTTGTRVLEHAEVREMMLAVREASLQLSHRMKAEASTGDLYFSFKLVLSVSNTGRVPAVAPYIKVTGALVVPMEGPAGIGFSRRQLPQGGWGVYASRDVLVHVEDIVDVAHIKTGLHIRLIIPGHDAKTTAAKIMETKNADVFTVAPFGQLRAGSPDQLIEMTIAYGAENVPVQHTTLLLDKWAMFKAMTEHL